MSGGGGEQTVGYKYYTGDRLLLGHDTFDKVVKIRWGGKTAWEGSAEYNPANPGEPVSITVNKPGLFGGESREGGVSGTIDILFGHSSQGIHSYLASKIQSIFLPAYRGVTSLVLRHFYIGNNPYIKELGITAQRIHHVRDGQEQWYDATAEMLTVEKDVIASVSEDFDTLTDFEAGYDPACYAVSGNVMNCQDKESAAILDRSIPEEIYTFASIEFRVADEGVGDATKISVPGFFSVNPMREKLVDSSQRLVVNGVYVGTDKVELGVWYKATCQAVGDQNLVTVYQDGVQIASFSTARVESPADKVTWHTGDGEEFSGGMTTHYRSLYLESSLRYETGEMNPAHMIREWFTHPVWGRGLPDSIIGDSYYAVADQLYAEGLGLSFYWSQEITHREAINEIQRHIDAVRYVDPTTGKLEIKLIRDDYDPAALPALDNSNSKVTRFDRKSRSELYNQITIKYRDRGTGDWATISLRDDTAIRRLGRTRNKTFEYPGIWRAEVALMVARRDLAANSREFARVTVNTNRRIANLKPGDVFKLNDPKNGISEMICRVAQRSDTASLKGEITLEAAEDIFGEAWSVYTSPTGSRWSDPIGPPQSFAYETAFEKPYIMTVAEVGDSYIDQLNQDACYYAFAGGRPGAGAHINYNLYAYPDGDSQAPNYEFAISGDFTPVAAVDGDVLNPLETVIPITGINSVDSLRTGHLVLIGNATDEQREIAAIDAEVAEGDLTVTLLRGIADTHPRPIVDGTVLYFIGDHYAGDNKEYLSGETVEGYGTPVNGQGYYLGPYNYHDVVMMGRSNLPYPPAALRIDGSYAFDPILASAADTDFVLTWSHRDRVLQSNQNISWDDATDYGPETGQTYRVEVDALDGDMAVISASFINSSIGTVKTYTIDLTTDVPPAGTIWLSVRLFSVRDSKDCLQPFTALIRIGLHAPSGLTATNI